MDFSNMNWDSLKSKTNFKEKGEFKADERFWTMTVDENGKGSAVIRLLVDKNETPFINLKVCSLKAFDQNQKKFVWFINDCPLSIGQPDPLKDFRDTILKFGKSGEEEAKSFYHKNQYIANIYVVKDPENPENEGKVFLWKFGFKLLDLIMDSMKEDGLQPFNPLKEGSNIKLKRKMGAGGFPTYDGSSVESPSAFKDFADTDEASDFIVQNTYELKEFLEPDYFRTYEDLKKSLKFFCSKYEPKSLSPEEFSQAFDEFFGEESSKSDYKAVSTKKGSEEKSKEASDDFDVSEPDEVESVMKNNQKTNSVTDDDIDELLNDDPKPKKETKKSTVVDDDIDDLLSDL